MKSLSLKLKVVSFPSFSRQPNKNSGPNVSFKSVPVSSLESGTYELIGPKIQSNRYRIKESDNVTIKAVRKGKLKEIEVPKHYFIKHGCVPLDETVFCQAFASATPIQTFFDFIIGNQLEGLVVHFSNEVIFKINRGHIGKELEQNDELKFLV